jgi:GMP synthase-like glutamine amidotransferase
MAILILEHSESANAGRLASLLRDSGHRLRTCKLHRGDLLPPDLDDVDGIVSCGGDPSANDDSLPWLAPEMDLLRRAHAGEIPSVGLCLGCQILARALGGEVERLDAGIELGWHPVTLTHGGMNDPVHAGIGWTTTMFHWHREQVIKLPQGANALAKSARTPVQAWSLGLRTYGFQYHPEVSPQDITRWIEEEPDSIAEAGISADQLIEETRRTFSDFHRISTRLFEQIALLVAPIDRRFAGLAKDLHH